MNNSITFARIEQIKSRQCFFFGVVDDVTQKLHLPNGVIHELNNLITIGDVICTLLPKKTAISNSILLYIDCKIVLITQ